MEEIELIVGDSSNIYEFSSKQVDLLNENWEGSWVVAAALGGEPILSGNLLKNIDIFNEDSLEGEDYKKSYKLFEGQDGEILEFNDDIITDNILSVSGRIYSTSGTTEVPTAYRYAYITIKGVFVPHTREIRIKTDADGNFTGEINLSNTLKTPANSFFIFQILPLESEQLTSGNTYFISVEVRQKNDLDELVFRKEVFQAKLKMKPQGVLS